MVRFISPISTYSDNLQIGGRKVTIFSPYVLINKTGLDMCYKAKALLGSSRVAPGQSSLKARKKDKVRKIYSSKFLRFLFYFFLKQETKSLTGAKVHLSCLYFCNEQPEPFLFSFSNFEPIHHRAVVKVGDSEWSQVIMN